MQSDQEQLIGKHLFKKYLLAVWLKGLDLPVDKSTPNKNIERLLRISQRDLKQLKLLLDDQ